MNTAARIAFGLVILLEILALAVLPDIASDFTWIGLIATAAFAWTLLEFLRLSPLTWWVAFAAVILDSTSALLELYSRIEPWDRWMHAVGGAIIAVAALELVLRLLKKDHLSARRQHHFVIGSVYLFTTTVGFLYEFWEYLVDKFQYGYPKSLVNAYDSVEDQLFNIAGATLVLALYYLWRLKANRRIAP